MDTRTLGCLGGGQLGRMMGEAALRLGVRMVVVDPLGKDSPAGAVVDIAIEGKFTDEVNPEPTSCHAMHADTNTDTDSCAGRIARVLRSAELTTPNEATHHSRARPIHLPLATYTHSKLTHTRANANVTDTIHMYPAAPDLYIEPTTAMCVFTDDSGCQDIHTNAHTRGSKPTTAAHTKPHVYA